MDRSQADIDRQQGKYQIEEQRESILTVAERLFLEQGIDGTRMVDIAAAAGITKVTLYRYFANIDVIALEVQVRQMDKIAAVVGLELAHLDISLETARTLSRSLIRHFEALREPYRYVAMFDSKYLDQSFETAVPQATKSRLRASSLSGIARVEAQLAQHPQGERFNLILSTVVWFLEKVALRGELTWSSPRMSLQAHLHLFEEMIVGYIDHCLQAEEDKAQER